jgi:hypothetical protein
LPEKRHLVLLLLLVLAGPCLAADGGAPLRGVDTVAIHIQGLEHDLKTYGVTEASLKSALAQRLATAGIKMVEPGDIDRSPRSAVLTLRLTLNRTAYYFFLYNLHLAVQSRLPLDRDPQAYTWVTTWSNTKIGMLMPRERGRIKNLSQKLADEFLKEYRRQNPG